MHADEDDPHAPALLDLLAGKAGRIVWNGWPTGVSVTWAMQHGGNWPATTASIHTSVGPTALRRFLTPLALQDVPASLLPDFSGHATIHLATLDGQLTAPSPMRAEQLTGVVSDHGEGPVFDQTWTGPRWVDMLAGDVCELQPDGSVDRAHIGSVAAMLRPRTAGGWVVADEHGVLVCDEDGLHAVPRRIATLVDDHAVRMNEGGCDPAGNLYLGSMAYDAARRAVVCTASMPLPPSQQSPTTSASPTVSTGHPTTALATTWTHPLTTSIDSAGHPTPD